MYDAVLQFSDKAKTKSRILQHLDLISKEYLLATIHRPYNTDNPDHLRAILTAFVDLNELIIFPVHPRTRARFETFGFTEKLAGLPNLVLTEPLGYLDFLRLMMGARVVLIEAHKMGGDYIRDLNNARGGNHTHACMPGCLIKCSNIYVDENGKEIVSPLEYETICLLGTNVGITEPDDVARLNETVNDLGADTIEVGATLGVLMDAGEAAFGDIAFMERALVEMRNGTDRGKLLAQGTARVGAHYGVKRVPVIKKQALSAYDPRVIEVTGITMTVTAQGADHTTGNLPGYECVGKTTEELAALSLEVQINSAAADSLGLCIFGRSVTNANHALIIDALNSAHGTDLPADFINDLGRETLLMEIEFNEKAGFTEADDALPQFFWDEALPPTGKKARHTGADINRFQRKALQEARSGA